MCRLSPQTIDEISLLFVAEGHEIDPEAIKKLRADSFVMETNIHYPTESSLIRDGLRKILEICSELAVGDSIVGWRQHHHLWKRVKQLAREIDRIAARKGPTYVTRMKEPYRELLQKATSITQRARELCCPTLDSSRPAGSTAPNNSLATPFYGHALPTQPECRTVLDLSDLSPLFAPCVTMVSIMLIGAGSSDDSARPTLPTTSRTSPRRSRRPITAV